MKLPQLLRRAKPLDEIAAEGVALQREADAAAAEIARLDAARPDLVLDAEPDVIAAHDAARGRLAIVLEQQTARLARLDGERAESEAAAEQARRRDVHAAAKKRRAAGMTALADYERHARAAAAALLTLAVVEQEIAEANAPDNLPAGVDPIPAAEPSNAVAPSPDRFHPPQRVAPTVTTEKEGTEPITEARMTPGWTEAGHPGRPHSSILQRTHLAGLAPGEQLFPPIAPRR